MDRKEFKKRYSGQTDEKVAEHFGVPLEDVQQLAVELALGKDKRKLTIPPMARWSAEEVALLQELYPNHSNVEIAQRLGRSTKAVISRSFQLMLCKSPEYLAEMGKRNISNRWARK